MEYLQAVGIFTCGEVFGLIIFPILSYFLGPEGSKAWDVLTIFKGIIERLVLFTALVHGYPQILIAFGAMKLGTRLHDEKKSTISNSYFLLGNLLSMFIAIVASIVTKALWQV